MSWARMILPKEEGGMDLKDPFLLARSLIIKRSFDYG